MKVIVAGIPRCGTTYMWRSLTGHKGQDIAHSYQGSVIKTHTPAPLHLIGFRAIFMFGDIVNAVISTHLNAMTVPHFLNCGVFEFKCTISSAQGDIFGQDLLGYERMFDSWNRYNGYPALLLRYETCHKYQQLISDFLGEKVTLLPWRERKTKSGLVQPDIVWQIKRTYKCLRCKVASMPDYKLIYRRGYDPWQDLHDKIKKYEISEG